MTTRKKWLSFVLVIHMVVATLLSSATPIFAKVNQQNKNGDWDRSSLSFIDQGKTTDGISAILKNGKDSEEMQGEVEYVVYRSDKGNPKNGEVVDTGSIPALIPGEEAVLTYSPPDQLVNGNYKFKAYQRTNHPGTGELWSETITVTEGISPEKSDETSEDKADESTTEYSSNESTTEDTQTEGSTDESTTEDTQTEDVADGNEMEETQTEDSSTSDTRNEPSSEITTENTTTEDTTTDETQDYGYYNPYS